MGKKGRKEGGFGGMAEGRAGEGETGGEGGGEGRVDDILGGKNWRAEGVERRGGLLVVGFGDVWWLRLARDVMPGLEAL